MIEFEIKPNKLKEHDSLQEIVTKLSEGNPGAMSFLMPIAKKISEGDIDLVKYLLVFDSLKLYGSRLYMLWNDCCGRDYNKTLKVIDFLVEGKITPEQIIDHIDNNEGWGKSFDDLLESEVDANG